MFGAAAPQWILYIVFLLSFLSLCNQRLWFSLVILVSREYALAVRVELINLEQMKETAVGLRLLVLQHEVIFII